MIGKAIHWKLTNDPAVSEVIGGRVYPQIIPQRKPGDPEQYPAVLYSLDTSEPGYTYSGRADLTSTTVDVGSIASTYGAAVDLSAKVAAALDGKGNWGGVEVEGVFLQDETDDLFKAGPDVSYYLRQQSYLILHR